ncbi:alpha/beta fold hydrolase [Streptomyces gardneri]|uniref:Alpha/beta hydrolase n=1 Tax=Streptomyces gardneri TaxID=66892 RepID=A0A4Y3RI05_9ACTN|nr:alpha/beta hydrolase [Streptomyces gardneri]GEB55470.1 alpha/beta hydrolase [Streptomyces gardneri]GHH10394.1 alpha/beta hydrolase [Streptomyces gardneri]
MFTFTSRDGIAIHVHTWLPEGDARGVVQIAHGMGEHAARYAPLAEHLTGLGFVVYAGDHRGHGLSMHAGAGHFGENGWNLLVEDIAALTRIARDRHPGVPVILLGHSMGSFAAQQYLLDHAALVDGVALSGTTAVDGLLTGLAEAARQAAEAGVEGGGVFDAFNAGFAPNRTEADWLSRDEKQVDAYLADPLCGFAADDRGMADMGAAAGRLAAPEGIPAGLPVYVLVGDHDPLNARLALSDLLVARYREAGLTDLTYRSYEGARHEVLNETNRDEVVADLTAWIERVAG